MQLKTWMLAGSFAMCACTPQGDPPVPSTGFADDFNRQELGAAWNNTGGPYQLLNGELHVRGARNKPLWLRRTLPRNVRIELDIRSDSPEGDIKVEVFGDGSSKAETLSYTATSYVVIFGGWHNQMNIIARMDEHADNRAVGPRNPVQVGRTYHLKVERRGNVITAWADGVMLATMNDPNPLEGRGHDHFAFNNWESDLTIDNLRITPL